MRVIYSNRFKKSYKNATERIKGDFDKQLVFLLQNMNHPSLHTKKYDESRDIWQARANRNWRFYFIIDGDTYYLIDLIQHPK